MFNRGLFAAGTGAGGPSCDPYYNNCVLAYHMEGTPGNVVLASQIIDSSSYGHTCSYTGAVSFDSTNKHSGSTSLYFSISEYIKTISADYTLGTGDFWFRCWFYWPSASGAAIVDMRGDFTNGLYPVVYVDWANGSLHYYVNSTDVIVSGAGAVTTNTGQWLDLSRVSGTTRMWLDGSLIGTWADSTNYVNTQLLFGINSFYNVSSDIKIDEVRFYKGIGISSTPDIPDDMIPDLQC